MLSTSEFIWDDQHISVTLSIGIAELNGIDISFDALTHRSDQLLYLAKRAGRNLIFADKSIQFLENDPFVGVDSGIDSSQVPI